MSLDTGPILFTLDSSSLSCDQLLAGGKAKNLWLLGQMVDCPVPPWFVITTSGFDHYIKVCFIIYYVYRTYIMIYF